MSRFLRGKIAHLEFSELLFLEVEAWAVAIFGCLPGIVGFVLRNCVYALLFKELRGFCWIQPRVTIVQANRLRVGKNFGCNSGTYINAIGGISMGDYVLIGSNVTISSGEHDIEGIAPPVFARPSVPKAICIEDDVWIAAGAVILPGVTLRKGSVVGANAVVTGDTEEYSVNVGAPARKVRTRTDVVSSRKP